MNFERKIVQICTGSYSSGEHVVPLFALTDDGKIYGRVVGAGSAPEWREIAPIPNEIAKGAI